MTDTEKKLRLTRFLREENKRNQIRMKNREEILYGSGRPLMPEDGMPLVSDGNLEDADTFSTQKSDSPRSTFRVRAVLAAFLFAAVLYMDKNDAGIAGSSAKDWICNQLNWSAEGKLIDFISVFPYTLSDSRETAQ